MFILKPTLSRKTLDNMDNMESVGKLKVFMKTCSLVWSGRSGEIQALVGEKLISLYYKGTSKEIVVSSPLG